MFQWSFNHTFKKKDTAARHTCAPGSREYELRVQEKLCVVRVWQRATSILPTLGPQTHRWTHTLVQSTVTELCG